MHPIYSAFLKHHLTSTVMMFVFLIAGIVAIATSAALISDGRDTAVMYLIPSIITTVSFADLLRNRFFTSKKRLNKFLSHITPQQNARMLAEFRYEKSGEIIAGDFLILLTKRPEFIVTDSITLIMKDGDVGIDGTDYSGRLYAGYIEDKMTIDKLKTVISSKRRSVICEGGRR
ncbi:MAG: hypothetical protein ACI4KM_03670 [Oscillospiraceae bacterium]